MDLDDHGTFKRVSTRMRTEARQLPLEVSKGLESQAEKLKRDIEQRAATILPRSGGLARDVSKMDMTVTKIANGVSLVAHSRYNIEGIDRGAVVHPVYGNRSVTVRQMVSPGFWTESLKQNEPEFVAAVDKALDKMANGIGA